MDRRRASPGDSRVPPAPVPLSVFLKGTLVGAFAALIVARLIVAGDDPGRLRLTSGGGPVSFNLCLFLVFLGTILWRVAYARGQQARSPIVIPLLLAAVGLIAYISSRLPDRYARPGPFIAWEWVGLAAAVYLTRRLAPSVGDSRGLLNVLVAAAVSVAGLGIYQALSDRMGLPTTEVVTPTTALLAGDDEFYPELNRPPVAVRSPRGTLDSPATLLMLVVLVLPVALVGARLRQGTRWAPLAIGIPGVLVAGAIAAILALPFESPSAHWSAAIRLIAEYPAFGVGPGNFSRLAPDVLTPHSAWLGLAATTGLAGLALFVMAVAIAIAAARPQFAPDWAELPVRGTPWAYYLGGMAGLLLGFVWSAGELPAEAPPREVFKLGGAAVLRAVLWFSAFALLEILRPTPRSQVRAILVGVGLVLALGLACDPPGLPTILFPMWVLLALAMNFCRSGAAADGQGAWTQPVRVTGAVAVVVLAIAYLVTAALPAWGTASAMRHARMASRHFLDRHREYESARRGPERANALTSAQRFLKDNILDPLSDAAVRDSTNAALWLELARWRRPYWEYLFITDPQEAAHVGDQTRLATELAAQIDPHHLAARRSLFEALLLYRSTSAAKQPERIAAMNKLIGQIAEREPQSEVPMRYRVVKMLLDRGEADAVPAEAEALLRLEGAEGSPHGRLTDEQRADVIERTARLAEKKPK